jgi:triosephosphate isomerase
MNLGPVEARDFCHAFRPDLPEEGGAQLLLFPPALSLATLRENLPGQPPVALGVQNVYWEDSGAFTGELSVSMAREAGATHVLIGHSERRHVFGETDQEVALKVKAALDGGMVPVICLGETLEERRAGRLEEVLSRQLAAVLPAILNGKGGPVVMAYEPVWAIGTGETATPEDASQAHAFLRGVMETELDEDVGREIPILYGGSVKPDNARTLLSAPHVGGVLVGGASLDPASFSRIAEAAVSR